MMPELDVYKFAPWELPAKAVLKTGDLNWYFLCPCSMKRPGRSTRVAVHGYWKSTGKDRMVNYNTRHVGKIKTLIFHRGKAPKGERTDWVMHEYKLEDKTLLEKGVAVESYVICKIYEKSGLGPKNGVNYGAPFVEEEWDNLEADHGLVLHAEERIGPTTPPSVKHPAAVGGCPSPESEQDELDRLLTIFNEDNSKHISDNEAVFTEEHAEKIISDDEIFNGLEDLAGWNSNSGSGFLIGLIS